MHKRYLRKATVLTAGAPLSHQAKSYPSALCVVAVGLLALLMSQPAQAVIIDDFTSGPLTRTVTGIASGWDPIDQTGLDPNHVAGGSRQLNLHYCCGPETGALTGSVITSGGGRFEYDSRTAGFMTEVFNLSYGNAPFNEPFAPLGIQLPPGGPVDIIIEILEADFGGSASLDFTLLVSGGGGPITLVNSPTPYSIVIPISNGTIDSIRFGRANIPPGVHFTLGSIQVIPEPASLTLLVVGMVGFRSRRHHTAE